MHTAPTMAALSPQTVASNALSSPSTIQGTGGGDVAPSVTTGEASSPGIQRPTYWENSIPGKAEAYLSFARDLSRFMLTTKNPGFRDTKASYCLKKALQAIVVSIQAHDEHKIPLSEHCYLLTALLVTFTGVTPEGTRWNPVQEADNVTIFALALLEVNPCLVPAFAFGYIRCLCNPVLIPLLLNRTSGWSMLKRLLTPVFSFLGHVEAHRASGGKAYELFETTVFRLMLVIMHDFPTFLCEYCSHFCRVLPPRCVQLRNTALSAFPSQQQLPDPKRLHFVSANDAEPLEVPKILEDWSGRLATVGIFDLLRRYYREGDITALEQLCSGKELLLDDPVEILRMGTKYNRAIFHSIILDIIHNASVDSSRRSWQQFPAHALNALGTKLILYLMQHLDTEGRGVLVSELCDHLRYANVHTTFAARLLFYLARIENYGEIVIRDLRRRSLTHRPHPWGILALEYWLASTQQTGP